MQVDINVNMKAEYIYDLLLFNTYSKFSGFLVNVLGLSVIIVGGLLLGTNKIDVPHSLLYVFAGIAFLSYTPIQLKKRAKKLMEQEKYQNSMTYQFSDDGVQEIINDNTNTYSWDQFEKAISTPKDIAFYLNESEALVIPKESFGDNFMAVMQLIAKNMPIQKIAIR